MPQTLARLWSALATSPRVTGDWGIITGRAWHHNRRRRCPALTFPCSFYSAAVYQIFPVAHQALGSNSAMSPGGNTSADVGPTASRRIAAWWHLSFSGSLQENWQAVHLAGVDMTPDYRRGPDRISSEKPFLLCSIIMVGYPSSTMHNLCTGQRIKQGKDKVLIGHKPCLNLSMIIIIYTSHL